MKINTTACFWLSLISLFISLIIFSKGIILMGLLFLIFGLITSYNYQTRYIRDNE